MTTEFMDAVDANDIQKLKGCVNNGLTARVSLYLDSLNNDVSQRYSNSGAEL